MLRIPTYIAALVVTGLLLAACGGTDGPTVAGSGSDSGGSATKSTEPGKDAGLKFSKCMRAHGIPEFPDPDAEGNIQIKADKGSALAPDSPKMQSAQKACESLMPQPSVADRKQMQAAALKFAKCIREHGVPDFPDPQFGEGPQIQSRKAGDKRTGPDPDSPAFIAAEKACKRYEPGGRGPTTHSSGKSDNAGPVSNMAAGAGS